MARPSTVPHDRAHRSSARASQPTLTTARVFHRVTKGQTLYSIAKRYGAPIEELCRVNRLKDPRKVEIGQVLIIPQGSLATAFRQADAAHRMGRSARGSSVAVSASVRRGPTPGSGQPAELLPVTPRGRSGAASTEPAAICPRSVDTSESRIAAESDSSESGDDLVGPDEAPVGVSYTLIPSAEPFSWPIDDGIVRSPFGVRHGRLHAGLDISAPQGSPVYAARDGSVVYSGHKFRGYGNVVMIDHGDGFVTLYAHNEKNLVQEGDRVARGQVIARVGATGNATGCHCHFEIRQGQIALDPDQYLPAPDDKETLFVKGAASSRPGRASVGVSEAGMMAPIP